MTISDTELRLLTWRDGFTQAERLAASVLRIAGFEAIDPQAPLGGGDGGKDIVCAKGGITWVGAVHFPTTACSYTKSKNKFISDINKVSSRHRGFAFITNQHLTIKQRETLEKLGNDKGKEVEIFHLERVRALLDAPNGYGVRLQFLRIPMTVEEQLAWFAESGSKVEQALDINTRELRAIKSMVQQLSSDSADIMRTVLSFESLNPPTPDLLSTSNFKKNDRFKALTSKLAPEHILLIHRLIAFDLSTRNAGVFRTEEISLAQIRSPRATAAKIGVPITEISDSLTELCRVWREEFSKTSRAQKEAKLIALARFHTRFLQIHPFADGNGRVSRAILMQQCLDIFGHANMSLLNRGKEYYEALQLADHGDFGALANLIEAIVSH